MYRLLRPAEPVVPSAGLMVVLTVALTVVRTITTTICAHCCINCSTAFDCKLCDRLSHSLLHSRRCGSGRCMHARTRACTRTCRHARVMHTGCLRANSCTMAGTRAVRNACLHRSKRLRLGCGRAAAALSVKSEDAEVLREKGAAFQQWLEEGEDA